MSVKIYEISEEIKKYARLVVREAQAKKIIPRPESCHVCGYDREMLAEERCNNFEIFEQGSWEDWLLDSHHPNYFKPFEIWHLCRKCHKKLHKIQIKYGMAILHLNLVKKLMFED